MNYELLFKLEAEKNKQLTQALKEKKVEVELLGFYNEANNQTIQELHQVLLEQEDENKRLRFILNNMMKQGEFEPKLKQTIITKIYI